MNNNSPQKLSLTLSDMTVIGLVTAVFLILLFGNAITSNNWGISQVNYLPTVLKYLWMVLALGALSLFFYKPPRHFVSDFLAPYLWGERKLIGRTIVLFLAFLVFVLFRFKAQFFGEGYLLLGNFASKPTPFFDPLAPGGTMVPYLFYSLLTLAGVDKAWAAIWGYQIVSIFSGLLFIGLIIHLAERLFEDNHDRITFLFLAILSGLSLLFFGLMERATLMLPLTVLYFIGLMEFSRHENIKHLLWLIACTAVGIFLHWQSLAFIPPTLYVLVKFVFKKWRRASVFGFGLAMAIVVGFTAYLYIRAGGDIALKAKLLSLDGKPPEVDYGLFDIRRLVDLLNLLFLISPLFPVFIFMNLAGIKSILKDTRHHPLYLLSVSQLLLLFIVDPQNGLARDMAFLGVLLVGTLLMRSFMAVKYHGEARLSRHVVMALCPAVLVMILPAFYTHLSPAAAEKYLDNYMTYNENKSEPYLYAKRDYYFLRGDPTRAALIESSVTAQAPGALESKLVDDLYALDRIGESFKYTTYLIEQFPFNAHYRVQRGLLLKYYKRPLEAEAEYQTAIKLAPTTAESYHYLSELYRELNLEHKCIETIETGLKIIPDDISLLTDLMGYHFRTGKFQQSDSLAERLLSRDQNLPYPYMYRGMIAEKFNRQTKALKNYNRFIEIDENLPEVPEIRKRINAIVLKQRDGLPEN